MSLSDNVNTIMESVADHRTDEFYAWNDFKNDFRAVKRAGNALLDGIDDFGADLDAGFVLLDGIAAIEEDSANVDYSRYELRRQEWQ